MFKRVIWWATGATMGAAGSAWAQRKVKRKVQRTVARYTPPAVRDRVTARARDLADELRSAVDEGRTAQDERAEELRSRFQAPKRR